MNSVNIIGRLTRDPEVRASATSGKLICQFSIAIQKTKDKAFFFDIKCFDKTAEFVEKYFAKGKQIWITGSLDQEQWEDKDTKARRSKVVVIANMVGFVGAKDEADKPSADRPAPAPKSLGNGAPTPPQENIDEDVPF